MMTRLAVFDRYGSYLGDLAEQDVFSATRHAVENGEDSLVISTTAFLAKGQRVLHRDAMLRWHEHIVAGGDEAHDSGRSAVGEYYCECSWAELRTAPLIIDKRPGQSAPVQASAALAAALEGTRWQVGEVDVTTLASARWYHVSPWEAVVSVVETWGGYLRADIEVGPTGVKSRKLSLVRSLGTGAGVRLDYGRDVSGIKATYDESDVYTALYCYGKGVETESGGYGRKIGIESVNGGVPYVEDADAKLIWGQVGPDGLDNAYGVFEDGEIEDPAELKAAGLRALEKASRPKVQYEATVEEFARAGTDLRGAGLGDRVDVVDGSFYRDRHGADMDLRLTGHVVEVTEDLLDPSSTQVVVGDVMGTVADQLAGLQGSVDKLTGSAPTWTDAATNATAYVNDLIDRLNQEINATGGYTYVKPGEGIWVYDKAEDQNPTKVINLMGGSMRIADSKTSDGEWDWRSVFVSGHIAADLVTAVHVTAGTIRSADGSILIDLDNGRATIGGYVSDDDLQATIERTEDGILSTVSQTYATQEGVESAIGKEAAARSSAIEQAVDGITTTVSETYATKDALADEAAQRESQIQQTAESITSTVSTVQGIAEGAQSAAEGAQQAADAAQGAADAAQQTATEVKQTADSLQVTITQVEQTADDALSGVETVQTYFRATSAGLTVGRTDEPSKVQMASNGHFRVLQDDTAVVDIYHDSSRGATIRSTTWGKVSLVTSNSSVFSVDADEVVMSTQGGGVAVNGGTGRYAFRTIESYVCEDFSSTGTDTIDVRSQHHMCSYVQYLFFYWHNTYTGNRGSTKLHIKAGETKQFDMSDMWNVSGDGSYRLCTEQVTVSVASTGVITLRRAQAGRASLSSQAYPNVNSNAKNNSGGVMFAIDRVNICC